MIKKMRVRVILAAMLAFFAVITLIAALVNIVNYAVVTNRADQTLDAILRFEAGSPAFADQGEMDPQKPDPQNPDRKDPPPQQPFMGLPDMEQNYMTRFFTVRFNASGDVIFASTDNIAAIGEEDAIRYARQILQGSGERGYWKEYRYAKENISDTTVVVFLNTSREQQSMFSLLVLTLTISLVSLLVVSLLVALLSKRAIAPIANNIRRQKQFITDASHELKTPLTSISTSVDVISAEHGDDEWTDNIRRQTGRMSKLVSELVTLSRLDEEIPLPNKEHFSLSDTAWEIAEVYKPQAKAAEKNLDVNIEENVMLFGEKSAIQQMLSVLLDNAIRYSDEKGEIRFSIYKKHGKACVEVFNTCSLDEIPDTDRLFDRFYRPDNSRSSETGGTGVGLSIAKAVADAHGGKISASCPSGKTMTMKAVF